MERFFQFGDYNTWSDWGLILTQKEIALPKPKTNYVDIDGMSGSVDLSQALSGEMTYEDRDISASFCACHGDHSGRMRLFGRIVAALHGRKMKIREPDDPEHYLYGRLTVEDVKNDLALGTFSVKGVCDPWRYAMQETVHTITASAAAAEQVIYNRGIKTLCPEITVAGNVTFECCGIESSATDGQYKISTFRLFSGENRVRVSGSGSLTLRYREAVL